MKTWILLTAALGLFGQGIHRAENFDTTGMPRRPSNFVEQQIFEMIATHQAGDLTDAARVQRKLGRYYADRGDERRSLAAFRLAADAQAAAESRDARTSFEQRLADDNDARPVPADRRKPAAFSGNYFGYEGRTLHTWDFAADGTFLHTIIVSGAGTGARNSERGRFLLSGEYLELTLTSAASGYVTPGAGARTTIIGGGSESSSERRRMRIDFVKSENAIVLDGIKLKPKSW